MNNATMMKVLGAGLVAGSLYLTNQYTGQLNPLKAEVNPRFPPDYLGPLARRAPMGLNMASVPLTGALIGGLYLLLRPSR